LLSIEYGGVYSWTGAVLLSSAGLDLIETLLTKQQHLRLRVVQVVGAASQIIRPRFPHHTPLSGGAFDWPRLTFKLQKISSAFDRPEG
jgi:hypothetical protein